MGRGISQVFLRMDLTVCRGLGMRFYCRPTNMAVTGVTKALESSNYQPGRQEVCFFGVEIMLTSHKHNLVSTLSGRQSAHCKNHKNQMGTFEEFMTKLDFLTTFTPPSAPSLPSPGECFCSTGVPF